MKKLLPALCCAVAAGVLCGNEIPKQFRVWGTKAPFSLSKANNVNGQVGVKSIRLPKGFKEEFADTNRTAPVLTDEQKAQTFLPFAFHPQRYLYHYTQPQAAEIGKAARAIGTPGEYVQMAFALRAIKLAENVELAVAPFADKAGKTVIPQLNIDLRRVMDLPLAGKKEKHYIMEPRYLEKFEEFDLLHIRKNYTERFFLTVKIPDNAAPGVVKSTVKVTCMDGKSTELPLMIRILPFKLDNPDPAHEMNFQILAVLNDPRVTAWGRDTYAHQMLRNMADIAEHGMNSIGKINTMQKITKNSDGTFTANFDEPNSTSVYSANIFFDSVKRAGLNGPLGFYNCFQWDKYGMAMLAKPFTPEWDKLIIQTVQDLENARKKNNWNEFVYVCGDEPGSSVVRLNTVKAITKNIKKAAPHVRTTAAFNGEWHGSSDWKICKEFCDINCANYFNERILAESKKVGYKEIWLYNGIERTASGDARSHRVFYGFVPFKLGANGVTQYHYRYAFGVNKKLDYAIYDHINGIVPDYIMTYPAPDGPLPSQHWEAIRQGIYDYRYLYTLKKRIEKCKDAAVKAQAQKVLDGINAIVPIDFMSEKRQHYLLKLSPETQDTARWKAAQAIMLIDKKEQNK